MPYKRPFSRVYKPRFSPSRTTSGGSAASRSSSRSQQLFRRLAGKRAFSQLAKRALGAVPAALGKSRALTTRVLAGPGTLSSTAFRYPIKPSHRRLLKTMHEMPKQIYVSNVSSKVVVPLGQQAFFSYGMYNQSDLTALFGSRVASPILAQHIGLIGATTEIQFGNGTNFPLWVDLYDVSLKQDIGTGTFEAANIANPALAFNQGLIAQGVGTMPNITASALNVTPFASDYFVTYYNIAKISRHYLEGGAVHRHRQSAEVNYYLNQEHESATGAIKKLNHWVLAVVYGTPAADSAVDTVISTNSGVLNWLASTTYRFVWIDDGSPAAGLGQTIPTTFTGNVEAFTEATSALQTVATT